MPMGTVSPGDQIRSTDHNSIVNAISGDAGETLTVFYKGADIISANALTLADDGNYWDITGTTSITSLSTKPAGTVIKLQFDGALTIVHDASALALSGGVSYLTAAGDIFEFISEGSGNWRESSRSLSAINTSVASTFGATPSLAFGTGNTAGTGTGFVRRNAVVAMYDTTAARTLAFGDVGTAGNVGSASGGGGFAAARDHGHAMPGSAVVGSVNNLLSVASTNGTFLWLPPYGLQTIPSTNNVVMVGSTNGNLAWSQVVVNPMTSIGDFIVGGTAGAVSRLAVVASTGNIVQVASTNGNLAWVAHSSSGTTIVITIAEWTADQATTSATFVNITSATLSSNTSATNKCDYKLKLNCLNDAGGSHNGFRVDISAGTRIQESGWTCPAPNYESPVSVDREQVDQATGAKTVLGQMATNGGSLSSYNSLLSLGAHTAYLRHTEYR